MPRLYCAVFPSSVRIFTLAAGRKTAHEPVFEIIPVMDNRASDRWWRFPGCLLSRCWSWASGELVYRCCRFFHRLHSMQKGCGRNVPHLLLLPAGRPHPTITVTVNKYLSTNHSSLPGRDMTSASICYIENREQAARFSAEVIIGKASLQSGRSCRKNFGYGLLLEYYPLQCRRYDHCRYFLYRWGIIFIPTSW